MKLYEVPNNTLITINGDDPNNVYLFKHIDGMYSLCYNQDQDSVHLFAGLEVTTIYNHENSS